MKHTRTHFEVRRPKFHEGSAKPEAQVFETLAKAQGNALQQALNGAHSGYTGKVAVVEVETHERLHVIYTEDSVTSLLNNLPSEKA